MQTLSDQSIIELIKQQQPLAATTLDGAFTLVIQEYVPYICTAIHNGHRLSEQLTYNCCLTDAERLYEEDPFTDELISSMPIYFTANDSRYEYDLNRNLSECIYKEAWGKKVWIKPLTEEDTQKAHSKHQRFYEILDALIFALEKAYGRCLIYDIHSYNYQRISQTETPTFNIGTTYINTKKWSSNITRWNKSLSGIELPNIEVSARIDCVFFGKGFLAQHVAETYKNTLALPTEIKKVYMNELTGESYPLVIASLREGLRNAILENTTFFLSKSTQIKRSQKHKLLPHSIDPTVATLDRELYKIVKGVDTLLYINPSNLHLEKRRFISRNYNYEPQFKYRQLVIDPFEFRERLYRLPIEKINDVTIQHLYKKVIDSYATKIDLLTSIGSDQFLYNSLRYYGEPSENDINNAKFLLYAPSTGEEEKTIGPEHAVSEFQKAIASYEINCRIEVSNKIVASAMVNNVKKTIVINKDILVSEKELQGLIHHELGVHMVTTVNAESQPLQIFKAGLPGNTWTQEGLAILSELLSGNLTLSRLQTLSYRVIAVHLLIRNYNFSRAFKVLFEEFNLHPEKAFNIIARVYRGGGFTKDYLYLRGLKDALTHYRRGDIKNLFVGKTSFDYFPHINELIDREIVLKPKKLPLFYQQEPNPNPVLDYLISAIR